MNRPSTVSNPERIRFEFWVTGTSVWRKYRSTHRACHLRKSVDGQYLDYRINDRWLAWNAALSYRELDEHSPPFAASERWPR